MRLLLQQLRKNGHGIARFHGPKSTVGIIRQNPYAFSWRETMSTASNGSKHQGSGSGKNSPGSAQSVGSQGSAQPGGSQGSAQSGGSQGEATPGGSPGSRNQALKLVLGSAAVVAAIATAFYAEWPGRILPGRSKREHAPLLNNEIKQSDMKSFEVISNVHLNEEDSAHSKDLTSSNLSQDKEKVMEEEMKQSDQSDEARTSSNLSQEKEQASTEETKQSDVSQEAHPREDDLESMHQEKTTQDSVVHKDHEVNSTVENVLRSLNSDIQEVGTDSLNTTKDDTVSDIATSPHKSSSEEVLQIKGSENTDVKEVDGNTDGKRDVAVGGTLNTGKDSDISAESYQDIAASKAPEKGDEPLDQGPRNTLSDPKENEHTSQGLLNEDDRDSVSLSKQKEDAKERRADTKELDGVLVLDFIEAIHAAEQRQAESDARIYNEYKRTLKEKYEKDLKDARARELMYAEEADSLEKELNKEKAKAAAALKSLNEKSEERLKSELRRKEEEVDMKLKKAQLLAKAETAAALANEAASHLNEMSDANIQINALRTAFYTRSEEARQSHSVHKLALGTFALEDALMKGAPLSKEIAVLRASMEGIDKDAVIDVVLSSLPSETLTNGTKTQAQLHQKFECLKGAFRELALIPANGGGLLTHALARFASAVKVKEDGLHSEGIESLISHVEHCLAEGKLIEAAYALEKGTQGSKAESLAAEWARQARNRVVAEQTLSLLHAYATAVASSLA